MEITIKQQDDVSVYYISKDLVSDTSPQLEEKIVAGIDSGEKKIVLEFTDLDYISSAGLRVLMIAAKKLRPVGGKLVIASPKEDVKEVFDIAGLSNIFPIFATLDEAIGNL